MSNEVAFLLGVGAVVLGMLLGRCLDIVLPRKRNVVVTNNFSINEDRANEIRATARQRAQELQRSLRGQR